MFDSIKLGQIISISKGKKHNLLDSKTELSKRYIQIDDLRNNLNLKYTDDKKGVFVTKDDVIIAWDGANASTVGYNLEGFIGSTLAVLRNKNPKEYNPQYLALFLQSKFSYLRARTTGATIPHLHRKTLENLKVPKLDIDDQKKIANLLTQVEALIAKREESIELLDELLRSSFLDMFGDPVLNDKGWDSVPLSKLGKINRGVSKHRPRNAPELLGGDYPLIQTGNVANADLYVKEFTQTYSDIGLAQSKIWAKDILCITIAANIAKTAILKFDACFPDSIVGMEIDKEESNLFYVHFLFKFFQKLLEKNAPHAAQKNINLQILRNLKVPNPPKPLQDKFATIVQQVETTKEQYQNSLDELRDLFGSLSQRAFLGLLV